MCAAVDPATIAKQSNENKKIVLDYITTKCTADSPFEDFRDIAELLKQGENKLEIKIITGGLANYSYKIFTSDGSKELYAKLTFPYLQLFPDKPCPLKRTENEFAMMKTFEKLSPGSVAAPYFCDDVGNGMKLLVAQWSEADEQFGNQFIDGAVDIRTAKNLGGSIAALHCSEVDKNWNEELRPFMKSMNPILEAITNGMFASEQPKDRVSAHAMEYGRANLDDCVAVSMERLHDRESLTHGDFHVFNIMVGKKPDPTSLERFAKDGNVVVCDFEMSNASYPGKDLGQFMAFPISCLLAHTLNSNKVGAQDIATFIETMWEEYFAAMKEKGSKTDADLAKIYRDHMIYCGMYMMCYYALDLHMNHLPIDEGNVEDRTKTKESIGVVALKCFILGCSKDETNLSLAELKARLQSWIEEEMLILASAKRRPSSKGRRRSSLLRKTGRRVSDGHLHVTGLDRDSFSTMQDSLEGVLADIDISEDF